MPKVAVIVGYDDKNNTYPDGDSAIAIEIGDFPLVPLGTTITLCDKETMLFENGVIKEIRIDNQYAWGVLVEVRVSQLEHAQLLQVSGLAGPGKYCSHLYPNVLSIYRNCE